MRGLKKLGISTTSVFYFYSQQNIQELLLQSPGRGKLFPFTESAHGILQGEGYRRHHWHKVLLQPSRWLPKDCITARLSSSSSPAAGSELSGLQASLSLALLLRVRVGGFAQGQECGCSSRIPSCGLLRCFGLACLRWIREGSVALTTVLNSCCTSTTELCPPFPPLSSQTYALFSVYQNCLIYSCRGFGRAKSGFCHSWRAAAEHPYKLSTLKAEAPKTEGKNKHRYWVFDFSVLPLLSFQRWVGTCQNLWQIRGIVSSNSSCYGKTDVGGKSNVDQINFLWGKKLHC